MSQLSRRTLVAAAATLPALAVPAVVLAATERDPIFAAIETHREAEAVQSMAYAAIDYDWPLDKVMQSEEDASELGYACSEAFDNLVSMTPTTLAGCVALLRHVQEHENEYGRPALFANYNPNGAVHKAGSNLLSRIAVVLEASGA